VERVGKYVLLTNKDLDRAEAWFAKHGEPVVLFGRLIPLLRSFVSLAAGLGEMAMAKFLLYTVIGCTIWCAGQASLGYGLGKSYKTVLNSFSDAAYVGGAIAVVVIAVVLIHRFRTLRAERVN
jgi:membrane protein DedA with SNARE-associated domain